MVQDEIKNMIIRRLAAMPEEKEIIVRSKPYHRDELIQHVEKGDRIGQKMITEQLRIMKALQVNGVWL